MLFRFCGIAIIVSSASGSSADPEQLRHAQNLQKRGDLNPARAEFGALNGSPGASPSIKAAALLGLGQIDLAKGGYPDAIHESASAAALFHAQGNRAAEGRALTTEGLALLYSGTYADALHCLNTALAIARELTDRQSEITTLNNIGTLYYFEGKYADAMQTYQQALRTVQSGPAEQWTISRRQLTLANIATVYQRLGQFSRAFEIYTAMRNSPVALPPNEQAQMLNNIGTLYRRLGDPVKALDTYREAQQLYRKSALLDGEAAVMNSIGIVQALEQSDYKSARQSFTTVLEMSRHGGDRTVSVLAYLYRAETLFRMDLLDDAAADFEMARQIAAGLNSKEEQWKALYGLARVADRRGNRSLSDAQLRKSIDIIESLRGNTSEATGRTGFLIDKRRVYDLLIDHLASRGLNDAGELFRLMEKSRARNLQDRLRGTGAGDANAAKVRGTLDAETALIEFWAGERSIAVAWLTRKSEGVFYAPMSADTVNLIGSLGRSLADPKSADWLAHAKAAGRLLLSGVMPLRDEAIRHLVIVPDGPLTAIPFEALAFGASDQLLIDRFSVSYLPFGTLPLSSGGERRRQPPWAETILGFADPAPGSGQDGLSLSASRSWPRLSYAAEEAESIAASLGGRGRVLIGEYARKSMLTEAGRKPPIIHLATHAFSDPDDGERSYVLFAPAGESGRFDYLFPKEIASLNLKDVRLLTLSACDSESGKLVSGEGTQSLSRAFLSAGAQTTVASLWKVGDRATAAFMKSFYRELAEGKPARDALRDAKLEFRGLHPAYWAAFLLNGRGADSVPVTLRWWQVSAILILPLLVFAAVLERWKKRSHGPRSVIRHEPEHLNR